MRKIILATDSFKGCLSSAEVEQALAEGIRQVFPVCQAVSIPLADGGEGMLDVLIAATNGTIVHTQAHDPLMRPRQARYGILGDKETAVIEMAEASGLTTLTQEERNPMEATTFGTGELIREALEKGYRKFIIGIGGSATNDAGTGMMQALGAICYDACHRPLDRGGKILSDIACIDLSGLHPALSAATFRIACDVQNPFHGSQGAAYVFARQKGATDAQIRLLDAGMKHLAALVMRDFHTDINVKGAGAAGGLGGAFRCFLKGELLSGIDLLLDAVRFDKQLEGADWVITGEGKADSQTPQGKVASGIARRAKRAGIPSLLIAGKVEDKEMLEQMGFNHIIQVSPDSLPAEIAMRPDVAKENIRKSIIRFLHGTAISSHES